MRESAEYRGRWVALDNVKFDGRSNRPAEGVVVDADDNLVALCTRMRRADMHHCTVVFCDDEPPPSTVRARVALPLPYEAEKEAAPMRLH